MKRTSYLLALLTATCSLLSAATLRVPSEYPHIKRAYLAATNGDTILLEAGEHRFENLQIHKSIHLKGEGIGKSTILYKHASFDQPPIGISGAGTNEQPVIISDLTFKGEGELSEYDSQFCIKTQQSVVTLKGIALQTPVCNFLSVYESAVTVDGLTAENFNWLLFNTDTSLQESYDLASPAEYSEESDAKVLEILSRTKSGLTVRNAHISIASERTKPAAQVEGVTRLVITDSTISSPTTPFVFVSSAFGLVDWPNEPSDSIAPLDNPSAGRPTMTSVKNGDSYQFAYGGMVGWGGDEPVITAEMWQRFTAITEGMARTHNSKLQTDLSIDDYKQALATLCTDYVNTRSQFPQDSDLDNAYLEMPLEEINFFESNHGTEETVDLIVNWLPTPAGNSKVAYGEVGQERADYTYAVAEAVKAALEADATSNFAEQLAAKVDAEKHSVQTIDDLIAALLALDDLVFAQIGIQPKGQLAEQFTSERLRLINAAILKNGSDFAVQTHQLLNGEVYSKHVRDSRSLYSKESPAARALLFSAYSN